jgi:hypothetical protein
VGKIGAEDIENRSKKWVSMISDALNRGTTVVLDYTDHHLGASSVMGDFYSQAVELVDQIVVPSTAMARLLANFYDRSITIIPDAIEVPVVDPGMNKCRPVNSSRDRKALWFGHQSNLSFLLEWLRDLELPGFSLHLEILTSAVGISILSRNRIQSRTHLKCTGAVWSVETMKASAGTCDFCVLPCGVIDSVKQGASSNRLLTALAMGLPTAADPLESYLEFRPYFTELRSEAFRDLVESPSVFEPMVRSAQIGPVSEHSLDRIGSRWCEYISSLR